MKKLIGREKKSKWKGISVNVANLQKRVRIDKNYVKQVAEEAFRLGTRTTNTLWQKKCEAGVIFVNNTYIKKLNKRYRKVNQVTDVIAFQMEKNKESMAPITFSPRILGDIFISADRAKIQAKDFGHSVRKEIAILTIHGILHLLGYNHKRRKDALAMRKKEEEILAGLEI